MPRRFSGPRLRALRTARNLRREQVALALGRSAPTIAGYELGRVEPTAGVLGRLADVLGCAVDEMFVDERAG